MLICLEPFALIYMINLTFSNIYLDSCFTILIQLRILGDDFVFNLKFMCVLKLKSLVASWTDACYF